MSLEDLKYNFEFLRDELNTVQQLTASAQAEAEQAKEIIVPALAGAMAGSVVLQELAEIDRILDDVRLHQAALGEAMGNYCQNVFDVRIAPEPVVVAGGAVFVPSTLGGKPAGELPSPSKPQPAITPVPETSQRPRGPIEIVKVPGFGSFVREPSTEAVPMVDEGEQPDAGAYIANLDEKVTRTTAAEGGFDTAHGRLVDLIRGTRNGDDVDVVAAIVASSLLSDSPEARQKLDGTVRGKAKTSSGTIPGAWAKDALISSIDALAADKAGGTPIAPLVLAADVINNNATSVMPRSEKANDAAVNQVVAAVRDNVEAYYGVETNDEGTVGFLAECRLHEQLSGQSPELQASLDKRLQHAWSQVAANEVSRPAIRRIYFKVLGISDPETVVKEGLRDNPDVK